MMMSVQISFIYNLLSHMKPPAPTLHPVPTCTPPPAEIYLFINIQMCDIIKKHHVP